MTHGPRTLVFFFFFQAEDGIRDKLVTGVQTCALPIYRFGIKPLYYRHVDGELAFASELRALPRGEIDLDALESFLAFNFIPAPQTIFRDVRKLAAGHALVWEEGQVRVERFARPRPLEVRTD